MKAGLNKSKLLRVDDEEDEDLLLFDDEEDTRPELRKNLWLNVCEDVFVVVVEEEQHLLKRSKVGRSSNRRELVIRVPTGVRV